MVHPVMQETVTSLFTDANGAETQLTYHTRAAGRKPLPLSTAEDTFPRNLAITGPRRFINITMRYPLVIFTAVRADVVG